MDWMLDGNDVLAEGRLGYVSDMKWLIEMK